MDIPAVTNNYEDTSSILYVQKSYYDNHIDLLYSPTKFADLSNCRMVKREYYLINAKLKDKKMYDKSIFNVYELEDGTLLTAEEYIYYNMTPSTSQLIYTKKSNSKKF